ncbi:MULTISPECIES: M15 family metallopeptidase [Ureibacillus]|uniref:D-alanyl-D-alanine carboxypeptidase n=1 Tax=Ureibacillus thermosphaericus TaxID=51173 RepID=A0A840PV89_URETH|nr:M15 family metallopeptidase [Ureibacillus thermosphaericus]MBB5149857.1 D-alanyl-D-alanine carboxypeptidase [Ureibacillus thermosphaericus]NKZ32568.1 M15 family metallopeptidase [Ureibacillus thermosphaericus]
MKNKKKHYTLLGILLIMIIAIVSIVFINNNLNNESETIKTEDQAISEEKENGLEEAKENSEVLEDELENSSDSQDEGKVEGEEPHQKPQQQQQQKPEDKKYKENNGYIEGQTLPSEPTYIKGVLIANKKYPLPKDYAPGENVEARAAFELMAQEAKTLGFELVAFSTYRSYEYQELLYNKYVERDGKENADRYSARPGYSEHQTGLAFDIGEKGREDLWLTEAFGQSEAGKWLAENAHRYGFILRYPKGKEHITGYMYESWHFRYLGVELATKVKDSGLTLEEYLGIDK